MSAVVSLTSVPRSSVPELARSARTSSSSLRSYLTEHGRELQEAYDWSGYCMLHVLSYLEDRDVDLEQSEFDAESAAVNNVHDLTVFITPAHKRFLDQLDPAAHRAEELAAHFDEMGLGFEGSGMAGLDGLRLLHDSVSELSDGGRSGCPQSGTPVFVRATPLSAVPNDDLAGPDGIGAVRAVYVEAGDIGGDRGRAEVGGIEDEGHTGTGSGGSGELRRWLDRPQADEALPKAVAPCRQTSTVVCELTAAAAALDQRSLVSSEPW